MLGVFAVSTAQALPYDQKYWNQKLQIEPFRLPLPPVGYQVEYIDLNGDGKINSIDLLVLQRHILEIEQLQGPFLLAGNINKNGKNPSSIDSLLIQRHILELKLIEQ